jgi:dephospho-CoA kinase
MVQIGVTGNIGAGKSTVCRIFEALGGKVYYADREALRFYELPTVIREVKDLAGNKVFDKDDKLIRRALAKIVFADPVKLSKLNAIIHPLVFDDYFAWTRQQEEDSCLFYESALLFESGFYKHFDHSILVTAPVHLAMKRVMDRDNISRKEFLARERMQMPAGEKEELASHIICNDEQQALIPKVNALFSKLCAYSSLR